MLTPSPGELLRTVRTRHGLDQRTLARRAGTTQAQVSRIERDEISPGVDTLARVLTAAGAQLELRTGSLPRSNASTHDLRRDYEQLTPEQRLGQAIRLSRMLTGMRPAGRADDR